MRRRLPIKSEPTMSIRQLATTSLLWHAKGLKQQPMYEVTAFMRRGRDAHTLVMN
jgi:hypothetical protein